MDIVVAVTVPQPYVLDVCFADGTRRRIDVEDVLHGEMFEPFKDPALFSKASVEPILGTVVWPNGADLSPEFLREAGNIIRAPAEKESPL